MQPGRRTHRLLASAAGGALRRGPPDSVAPVVLGVDVGGTKVAVAAVEGVSVRDSIERPTVLGSTAALLDGLEESVRLLIGRVGQPTAIGVGVPSQIEYATGTVETSVNIPLTGVPLRAELGRRCGRPVVVDNDANCAALAEAHILGEDNLVMLTLGTGVGGGVLVGNVLGIIIALYLVVGAVQLLGRKPSGPATLRTWSKIAIVLSVLGLTCVGAALASLSGSEVQDIMRAAGAESDFEVAAALVISAILMVIQIAWAIFLLIWFAFQAWDANLQLDAPPESGGVAVFAHLGGIVFGLVTVKLFQARDPMRPAY
jgi:membrane associated rhomboid family serine protease